MYGPIKRVEVRSLFQEDSGIGILSKERLIIFYTHYEVVLGISGQ